MISGAIFILALEKTNIDDACDWWWQRNVVTDNATAAVEFSTVGKLLNENSERVEKFLSLMMLVIDGWQNGVTDKCHSNGEIFYGGVAEWKRTIEVSLSKPISVQNYPDIKTNPSVWLPNFTTNLD
jgi:hypothetical protein